MTMNWLAFGGSAVLLGMVAACWRYVRVAWSQVASRVVVHVTVFDFASQAVMGYCRDKLTQSRFGPRTYSGFRIFVRPRNRLEGVAGENLGHGTLVFWKGWKPIWVTRSSAMTDAGKDECMVTYRPVKLTFLRGMFSPDELIEQAVEYYNHIYQDDENRQRYEIRHMHGTAGKPPVFSKEGHKAPSGRNYHHSDTEDLIGVRLLKWKLSDLGTMKRTSGEAVECVALSKEGRDLWEKIKKWHEGREWFLGRSLPWKYGSLLYGVPGTGKTCFVRAIAEDLDLPVFSFDLSSMFNDELREKWMEAQAHAPAIILIEDVDGVFRGREPASENIKLTFDALLNCIDGVDRADGILLFVTTNKIETLDPALGGPTENGMASRPGRIDASVLFGPLDQEGREKIAGRILKDWPEEIESLVSLGEMTGAQFERRCIDRAEQLYWQEKSL